MTTLRLPCNLAPLISRYSTCVFRPRKVGTSESITSSSNILTKRRFDCVAAASACRCPPPVDRLQDTLLDIFLNSQSACARVLQRRKYAHLVRLWRHRRQLHERTPVV